MSRKYTDIPSLTNNGANNKITLWLARWIVGAYVKCLIFSGSLYAWTTSLDFSYGEAVSWAFTSSTSLASNILVPLGISLIETSLKTPFPSRESISLRRDSSKGNPGVVITPLARRLITTCRSRFSFLVRNTLMRNEPAEVIMTSYSIALTRWIA